MKIYDGDIKLLPRFSLGRVTKIRKRLEEVFESVGTTPLDKDAFLKIARRAISVFPESSVLDDKLFGLLTVLTTKELTKQDLRLIAARLAGSLDNLKRGETVSLDKFSAAESWNVVEIVDAITAKGSDQDNYRCLMRLQCIAGPWAGSETDFVIGDRQLKFVSSRTGFSRRVDKLRYRKLPFDFVGLQLLAYLIPKNELDGSPRVDIVGAGHAQKAHNKKIIRARREPCPFGNTCACVECLAGIDTCRLACRMRTMYVVHCYTCHKPFRTYTKDSSTCQKCLDLAKTFNGINK